MATLLPIYPFLILLGLWGFWKVFVFKGLLRLKIEDEDQPPVVEMTQMGKDKQLIWYEYGPELYLTVCQTGYVDELKHKDGKD